MSSIDTTMMSDTPISDELKLIRDAMGAFQDANVSIRPDEIDEFRAALRDVMVRTLRLERQLLLHRYARGERREFASAERLAEELERPGTNVQVLHPEFREVPFGDGEPAA